MLDWFGRFCIVFIAMYFYCALFGVEATGPQVVIYSYVFYHVFEDSLE